DSGDAAPGADDHVAADLLPQDAIRAADVVLALGRNGGGLQAEAVLPDGCRGLVDDLVVRAPTGLEREVEALELELEADHVGREDANGLFEQFLPGLVPLEDGDGARVHRAESSDCNLAQNCFDLVSSRRSTGEGD